MSEDKKICFVIMPFSETTPEHTEKYWTDHFDNFLKLLIEENPDLEGRRSEPLRGDILRQIITDLVVSPIVVADLTDKNANVFWELGVRQSFKHGTITIAEEGTKLPFDIGNKGTLFYNPEDYIKMASFRGKFKQAIQDCLSHPDKPDSHVLDTLSGRGTLFEIFLRDETIRRLDAFLFECDMNLNFLKIITDTAKQNLEIYAKGNHPFIRLSTVAIDLLITERYIDISQNTYELAAQNRILFDSLNDILMNWSIHPEGKINGLIISSCRTIATVIELIKSDVKVYRDKVNKLF
ncbi:MAG: hypothetical protein FIB08_03450 [Candidatus Methanoperedens sp.]|nr:hypothetical protein [Candidatus Methanoperedens sp.]